MPVNTVDKLEKEAAEWLESVTGENFDSEKTFQENLKDGTILCKAFNVCFIDMKVKYTHSAMPFKQMENIATFLAALSKLPNFRSFDLFSTVDLFEGKNMASVTRCILACKRIAEKELLNRGIETLKVEDKQVEEHIVVEPVEEQIEETKDATATNTFEESEIKEAESFEEIQPEQVHEPQRSEDFEVLEQTQPFDHVEPEIVLIDSPVFADDESGPIINENSNEEFEEYETFTMENPGTFEIQVTDQ